MALAKKIGDIQWSHVETEGNGPGMRSGHSLTVAGDTAVLFGGTGVDKSGSPEVFNDTYMLSLDSEPYKWTVVDVMGDVPTPRWRHTATLLPGATDQIVVFGGHCKGRRFNDTYIFMVKKGEWEIKECAGTPPHPRSHHTANVVTIDRKSVV